VTGPLRIAAVSDLHLRTGHQGRFRPAFLGLAGVDVLLLGGDLTNGGTAAEIDVLAAEVAGLPVPVVAVLGNHDHDEGLGDEMTARLSAAGVTVLDGDGVVLDTPVGRLGIAGVMGGGGGFPGTAGEPPAPGPLYEYEVERRRRGPVDAERLRSALQSLDSDVRVALTHFAPIAGTLAGEPESIYPSLGCQDMATVLDAAGVHMAIHGHAHAGTEIGTTPGGVPVRNVAFPVLRRPYATYVLSP
jgi:Icc-related predicted phosphoesterase